VGAPGSHNKATRRTVHDGREFIVCGNHPDSTDFATKGKSLIPEPVQQEMNLPAANAEEAITTARDSLQESRTRKEEMMDTPTVKVMVTGHVDLPNQDAILETMKRLWSITRADMYDYYGREVELVGITGMANGADRLWALACYESGIPFDGYVPPEYPEIFIRRPGKYNPLKTEEERELAYTRHYRMRDVARELIIVGERKDKYTRGDNFRRNEAMIRDADMYLCVSKMHPREVLKKRPSGGTNHAIQKMANRQVGVITWIDPARPDELRNIDLNKEA